MRFSERMGFVPVNEAIQTEGMSDDLHTSLWNVLDLYVWTEYRFTEFSNYRASEYLFSFTTELWANFYKLRLDSRPDNGSSILNFIRQKFYEYQWYEVYDFVEFVVSYEYEQNPNLVKAINVVLKRELAGFRIIENQVVPISDDLEKLSVEEALAPGLYEGVRCHLIQALQHLSDRENPDYRNSIKESISAVESLACELSGKPNATLGEALRVLESKEQLHGALKAGFSAIYGYTSDADGIRHKMLEASALDADDAKFFLVACTTFINYLKAKYAASQ